MSAFKRWVPKCVLGRLCVSIVDGLDDQVWSDVKGALRDWKRYWTSSGIGGMEISFRPPPTVVSG